MRIRAAVTGRSIGTLREMQEYPDRAKASALEVVNDAAEQTFAVSQRMVPVDVGNLKASGDLDRATLEAQVAAVSYSADYALPVHELHATKSGYLSRALDTVWENLPSDVADRIAREW